MRVSTEQIVMGRWVARLHGKYGEVMLSAFGNGPTDELALDALEDVIHHLVHVHQQARKFVCECENTQDALGFVTDHKELLR